ncbi:MAG: succinate dehydrogenase assembly factor 4 [Pseudomonadota bacterium]
MSIEPLEKEARIRAAAARALAEAEARKAQAKETSLPKEHGGPQGPEPTRHGDWEVKGIASDF